MPVLFISDLHLQPQRPQITRAFFNLLESRASRADALYILGDFFDVWVGDDESTPLQQEVAQKLRQLTDSGTPVWFMPGNRDFLLGDDYCKQAGIRRLPDPSRVEIYTTPVLLMHGDSLCTDDKGYQRYRRFIRSSFIRRLQRVVSLQTRQKIGRLIRGKSSKDNQYKSRQLLDINSAAAKAAMEQANVSVLVHGHTHRPGRQSLQLASGGAERIVLGDWDQHGWLLQWNEDGSKTLECFDIPTAL